MTDSFQWERCDSGGSTCVDIAAATAASYLLASPDDGHIIRARGYRNGVLVGESNGIGPISAAPPVPGPGDFATALNAWIPIYFTGGWTTDGHLPASVGRTVPVSTNAQFQAALNDSADGDTIELGDGVFGPVVWGHRTHSDANPPTITRAGGASPVLSTPTGNHALDITTVKAFRLKDLFFDQCAQCAVKIEMGSTDIEIIDCEMTRYGQVNTGHGVLTDYEIERLALWNSKTHGGGDHGLYLGSQGVPAGSARFGIKGLLVANHRAYDNFKGPGSASGASAGMGIQLGDSVVHARVVSFTTDHNGVSSLSGGGGAFYTQASVNGDKGTDVEWINGLFTNNVHWGLVAPGTAPNKLTNHLTYCLGWANGDGDFSPGNMLTLVLPNFHGDPGYANRSAKDFHPSMAGAAHDVGDPTWMPVLDADGDARVTADLGALASV